MLEFILDPIFQPIMGLKPFYAVLIISLGITILITFIYKWTTDQVLMKSLKAELKKSQDEIKKNKDDPSKMMALQKKAMSKNMEYMKHSFKSTLYTMLPIIIIFGYLNTHLGFLPIMPGQEFSTTVSFKSGASGDVELLNDNLEFLNGQVQEIENGQANWELRGEEGEYILEYEFNGESHSQELLITEEKKYRRPILPVKRSDVTELKINNEKIIALNLFGWKLGWLGTYIILSILFSTLLRKGLKIA